MQLLRLTTLAWKALVWLGGFFSLLVGADAWLYPPLSNLKKFLKNKKAVAIMDKRYDEVKSINDRAVRILLRGMRPTWEDIYRIEAERACWPFLKPGDLLRE